MEVLGEVGGRFLKFILLILLACIFLPAFFIVHSLNKTWGKLLAEFGL